MKNLKVDFHIHTSYSDGKYGYEKVCNLIKENNIKHFSITDHDIYDYNLNAFLILNNIKGYQGIELSTKDYNTGRKVHFLTFNFNNESKILKEYISYFIEIRNKNIDICINNLKEVSYIIDNSNNELILERKEKGLAIYKQHLVHTLIKTNRYGSDFNDLYKKLKNLGVFPPIKYISYLEGMSLINDIGGISILAHPGLYNNWNITSELIKNGLDGIEVFHKKHSDNDIKTSLEIGEKNKLLITGGSDYHGWRSEDKLGREIDDKYVNSFLKVLDYE